MMDGWHVETDCDPACSVGGTGKLAMQKLMRLLVLRDVKRTRSCMADEPD